MPTGIGSRQLGCVADEVRVLAVNAVRVRDALAVDGIRQRWVFVVRA
jgi:hypothetical protein